MGDVEALEAIETRKQKIESAVKLIITMCEKFEVFVCNASRTTNIIAQAFDTGTDSGRTIFLIGWWGTDTINVDRASNFRNIFYEKWLCDDSNTIPNAFECAKFAWKSKYEEDDLNLMTSKKQNSRT